jgi:redox-sensitive bicupin YhaK (pirin superfamily)
MKMIKSIPSASRHFSDFGWLKTYWLFSFSDYYDPDNIQFGALRVFNDDVIAPGTGFPTHPHREMEIITIVLDGEVTHEDSLGNRGVIKAGEVQRMSAGSGITHSEFNLGKSPVHLYQVWIFPDEKGLKPSYDQSSFEAREWHNRLLPVASGQGLAGAVIFHTDATIYRAFMKEGTELKHAMDDSRRSFIYLSKGEMDANGVVLRTKDQARIDLEKEIVLRAVQDSELILIDVPSCKGWGYDGKTLRGARK